MTTGRFLRTDLAAVVVGVSLQFLGSDSRATPWDDSGDFTVELAPQDQSVLAPGDAGQIVTSDAGEPRPELPFDPPPPGHAAPIQQPAIQGSGIILDGSSPEFCTASVGDSCPPPPGVLHQPGLFQWLSPYKQACWTVRTDALLLWRSAPGNRPLYSTVDPSSGSIGPTALNANDLESDVLVAPRISLLRTNAAGTTFETTYFYAGNFFSDRSLPYRPNGYATSPPGIYGNNWGPPDTSLDSASATLLGQLQSLEFNAREAILGGACQFLIGARWLQWNETLRMTDSFAYAEPEPVAGNDFYETRCFNNLWGGQIGLDALLLGRSGMARVEGIVKAGAYYNAAGQTSSFKYVLSDGTEFLNQARAGGPAACSFVGEVGLTAVLSITCSCDFRCGYSGLWLSNLAQPTRQLSDQQINQFDTIANLNTSGSVLLQGLSLGLESRW